MDVVGFGEEVLVPVVGVFCIFGLPVIAFIVFRLLAHRERIEMIRSGLAPGSVPRQDWREAAAVLKTMRPGSRGPLSLDAARITLQKGIRLTFVGFALTIGLSFIGYRTLAGIPIWEPGPWLLAGLVPMFVGIAQIVTAMLDGATFGPVRQAPPPYGGPPPGPGPGADAPSSTYEGPYTYRPGDAQELRRPAPPLDRRD
jgi:hypothetical protein